jgi:hypothetical protein
MRDMNYLSLLYIVLSEIHMDKSIYILLFKKPEKLICSGRNENIIQIWEDNVWKIIPEAIPLRKNY